jgi:hypothetical protein
MLLLRQERPLLANRTIKERVRAAYHQLPYKALPRQLIWYLVQTQASQLNLFPAKGGLSLYYSPRTILGLPTVDYVKHCTVPFGAYVQANHETNQTNSNASQTIDAIYLRPVNSMQGGHELYDLNSGRVITRARVTQIPVTDMVIKGIKRIAEDQGFKSLKFKNCKGAIFHDADWIAGVDYDENIQQEDDHDEDFDENNSNDPDEDIDDDQNDQIEKDKLEDLSEDAKKDNPNRHREQDKIENEEENEQESEDEGTAIISEPESDSQTSEVRRSTRMSRPVERLEPNMTGKSYIQNNKRKKRVSFVEDELRQLEYCQNLVAQVKPDEEMNIEYGSDEVMLIARFIQDITTNVNKHRASFAQQYMLQKGLKVFGNKGHKASIKEINQLHKRMCFAPLKVTEIKHSERKKAQMALMFLTEKRDKSMKGRMV